MTANGLSTYLNDVLHNMPKGWLSTTTHRLDIYNESLAKTEFLVHFKSLFEKRDSSKESLKKLPTAYDYIRLGHPLSCVLEWAIAKELSLPSSNVISFSSRMAPILAVLRKNHLDNVATKILYHDELPSCFDASIIRDVYGYLFELEKCNDDTVIDFDGCTIILNQKNQISNAINNSADFQINLYNGLGSMLILNRDDSNGYIAAIQHVRRRETIAMTPANALSTLKSIVNQTPFSIDNTDVKSNKNRVLNTIKQITNGHSQVIVGSSGLSIQYAIMMGLVHDAQEKHPGKAIKFIVPTNCYGGTNDQARRVAACNENVAVVDLAVDGDNDMVTSLDTVLDIVAQEDAIPYIIAEIPTNPRVEVPDISALKNTLNKKRTTNNGTTAITPVFILDQTFCPNVHFLGENDTMASIKLLSYVSGSKFPSGGKCTAGYCIANKEATGLMEKIDLHLTLCDNEATALQYKILATQLPSMLQRIDEAYKNTRDFVTFIEEVLPTAKINFVSTALAEQGFRPSVFSLDLPTKGDTAEEREEYKRALNLKLINSMIEKIPSESKYCVSYGQLEGVYWTIPATSTQGTTKEGDKDYIARVSLSPNMDLEKHKEVFLDFVKEI